MWLAFAGKQGVDHFVFCFSSWSLSPSLRLCTSKQPYYLGGEGSVKRLWSAEFSSLHKEASGPASMRSTICVKKLIMLWTMVIGSADSGFGDSDKGVGAPCEGLASLVTIGSSPFEGGP